MKVTIEYDDEAHGVPVVKRHVQKVTVLSDGYIIVDGSGVDPQRPCGVTIEEEPLL